MATKTGQEDIALNPLSLSLRDIQAQGGRISSIPRVTRKKVRRHGTKIYSKDVERSDSHSLINKRRSDSGPVSLGMDDQMVAAAQRTSTILDEQLRNLKNEHGDMKEFIRDILYTLNARGYESITDSHGGLVDLNRCRGENLLDLKGRDARARQQCPGRRLQGQDNLLKAVIGSQEKLIRNLMNQLNASQRTEFIGSRFSSASELSGSSLESEREKTAILEKEILGLVNFLEAAIDRHPGIYVALKEQLLEGSRNGGGGGARNNGILSAVLARHQLISNIADENRSNRIARVRRKLVPYCGDTRRYVSQNELKPLTTVGKAIGLNRDKHILPQPRPPTPGILSNHHQSSTPRHDDEPFESGVTFKRSLILPLTSPRPVTSINEYSSRKLRRGMGHWAV